MFVIVATNNKNSIFFMCRTFYTKVAVYDTKRGINSTEDYNCFTDILQKPSSSTTELSEKLRVCLSYKEKDVFTSP